MARQWQWRQEWQASNSNNSGNKETITDLKSPWMKLGKTSQKPEAAESAIVTAGLNAPAYWNGIR